MNRACLKNFSFCMAVAFLFFQTLDWKSFAAPPASKPNTQAKLLKGNINQLLVLCSYAGITLDKDVLPAKVSKIKLGTPAAYSGLSENDQVLGATVEKDQLSLQVARADKKFSLRLPLSAAALRAATNAGANTPLPDLKLGKAPKFAPITGRAVLGATNETKEQKAAFNAFCQSHSTNLPGAKPVSQYKDIRALKDYDFVVLVDHSGSMRQSISGTTNVADSSQELNKWQWIQNQVSGAASELSDAFRKGIKLIMFATDYQVYDQRQAGELVEIFRRTKAEGDNFLMPPLREVIKQKITSGRPMVICVVTDGLVLCPYNDLRDCIINTTKAIPGKYDLMIYFLVVNNKNPDADLMSLKEDLIQEGALHDIVNVKTFDEIDNKGLIKSLIESASN